MILCDIGNTTFDFYSEGKRTKYFLNEDIPKFKDEIYYVSVNENAKKKLIINNPHAKNINNIIEFETSYIGLGDDRKLACIFQKDSIIVDAGSAITVDIMQDYKHIGGFILLGFKSYVDSYSKISEKLKFDFEKNTNLDKIPLKTKDAIQYAMLKSIILPIKEISINKSIIFTGGNGEYLCNFFENSTYKKDLIFENMKRIIDANNCSTKR